MLKMVISCICNQENREVSHVSIYLANCRARCVLVTPGVLTTLPSTPCTPDRLLKVLNQNSMLTEVENVSRERWTLLGVEVGEKSGG